MIILYAAHGLNKDADDTGEFDQESFYNLGYCQKLWQLLADKEVYCLMPRPSTGTVCADKLKQVCILGDFILEIHSKPDITDIEFVEGTENETIHALNIPVVRAICPFYDTKNGISEKHRISSSLLEYLENNHSEYLVKKQVIKGANGLSIPPCKEKRN